VNGPEESLGATGGKPSNTDPLVPNLEYKKNDKKTLYHVYKE